MSSHDAFVTYQPKRSEQDGMFDSIGSEIAGVIAITLFVGAIPWLVIVAATGSEDWAWIGWLVALVAVLVFRDRLARRPR